MLWVSVPIQCIYNVGKEYKREPPNEGEFYPTDPLSNSNLCHISFLLTITRHFIFQTHFRLSLYLQNHFILSLITLFTPFYYCWMLIYHTKLENHMASCDMFLRKKSCLRYPGDIFWCWISKWVFEIKELASDSSPRRWAATGKMEKSDPKNSLRHTPRLLTNSPL